jgi:hypothetical protein
MLLLNIVQLLATKNNLVLLEEFTNYAYIFLEEDTNKLLSLKGRQYIIELKKGSLLPYSPIYNLSKKELGILWEYLGSILEKGWI